MAIKDEVTHRKSTRSQKSVSSGKPPAGVHAEKMYRRDVTMATMKLCRKLRVRAVPKMTMK